MKKILTIALMMSSLVLASCSNKDNDDDKGSGNTMTWDGVTYPIEVKDGSETSLYYSYVDGVDRYNFYIDVDAGGLIRKFVFTVQEELIEGVEHTYTLEELYSYWILRFKPDSSNTFEYYASVDMPNMGDLESGRVTLKRIGDDDFEIKCDVKFDDQQVLKVSYNGLIPPKAVPIAIH